MKTLEIKDLHVRVEGKDILNGVTLKMKKGEFHSIMGPNGSGKSTLAHVLMGHPRYEIVKGDILLDGKSILDDSPDARAKKGLFLGFQYPSEVAGVTMTNFLLTSYRSLYGTEDKKKHEKQINVLEFRKQLNAALEKLKMKDVAGRFLNEGFSGGEKKRSEVLQMAVLKPQFAVLDEIDSGLDIDALKVVAKGINAFQDAGSGVLLITHYQRILNYLKPDFVHVMLNGSIATSGRAALAQELEEKGYEGLKQTLEAKA